MNKTINDILTRRTIRSYTSQDLTNEELDTLIACAKSSPSGRNSQPCLVRIVRDKKILDEINTDFKNTVGWDTPAYTRYDTNPVYHGAPVCFFIFSDKPSSCAMDAGIMVENIAVASKGLELGSVIIGSIGALFEGEFADKWYKYFDVPRENPFMIAISVGHPDENPEMKPRKEENFRIL